MKKRGTLWRYKTSDIAASLPAGNYICYKNSLRTSDDSSQSLIACCSRLSIYFSNFLKTLLKMDLFYIFFQRRLFTCENYKY